MIYEMIKYEVRARLKRKESKKAEAKFYDPWSFCHFLTMCFKISNYLIVASYLSSSQEKHFCFITDSKWNISAA